MFSNITEFNSTELLTLFGSSNVFSLPEIVRGVSTDTRTLVRGNIFVALRGERFDGHDRIDEAIANGAAAIITEKKFSTELKDFPHILVDNSLHALGLLACFHRKRFSIPVVAIAGATGKTSTKDLTAHVLSQRFSTLKTQANYNNQIGVPLTLLQLSEIHQAAVIEIGTNEPGEIEILSEICAPNYGLITNIGKEHLEKLIDLDGVEREETALFRYLANSSGIALVNRDDERLRKYEKELPNTLNFSINSPADIYADVEFNSALQPNLSISGAIEITAQLCAFGYAAALNAIAAVAVGVAVGLNQEEIKQGLESYIPPEAHGYGRMNVQHYGDITILNDCYNANPDSMMIALKTLKLFRSDGRKIALLGDMRELGASAASEHVAVIEAAQKSANVVIVIGDESVAAAKKLPEPCIVMNSKNECIEFLRSFLSSGDVLLVKGSRGMKMEEIIAGLW